MGRVIPFMREEAVFGPHEITAMAMALNDICKTLNIADGSKPARLVIAQRIIDIARHGERSPTVLRDRVLEESALTERPLRWSGC